MSIYDIVNRMCESQEKIELMGDITGAAIAVGLVLAIVGSICLIIHLVNKYDLWGTAHENIKYQYGQK